MDPKSKSAWTSVKAQLKLGVSLLAGGLAVIAVADHIRTAEQVRAELLTYQEACIALGGTVVIGDKGASSSCITKTAGAGEALPVLVEETVGIAESNHGETLPEAVSLSQPSHG